MRTLKITAFLLVLLLVFNFTGCKKTEENGSGSYGNDSLELTDNSDISRDYITLLYSASDTFNPYTLKTNVNRQVCKLLYEPLVKVDNEFNPVLSLATSADLKGKECVVKLKSVYFSDGTLVSASDVVYSYNLAKKSETAYASNLYEVASISASGNDTVVFKLTKSDPYFLNLIDFPIIKKDSDKLTDSDSVLAPPVGCGKYKVNEEKNNLVLNNRYFGKRPAIKEIRLINAPDKELVTHYTEIGAADMYFSEISEGDIMRMSGKRCDINLNNLVYIGVNHNYAPLGEQAVRQAISSALGRSKICTSAYYNNAVAANGFFHPFWKETKSVQNIQVEQNNEITIENLKEIGYNNLDNDGIRKNSNGTKLKFTLLVNSENKMRVSAAKVIASQLENAGIGIKIIEKSNSDYKSALKSGSFQLYLGEVRLTDNMDISPLVVSGGSVAYGLSKTTVKEDTENTGSQDTVTVKTGDIKTVLDGFYSGKNTIKDVASVLQTEMPVIPVCYRTGVLIYSENIENVNNSSLSDIYFSIDSYLIN